MGCYDIAKMIIDESTNKFGNIYELNDDKIKEIKFCCEIIDSLYEEFEGESYTVEVDEETMNVVMTLECGEIVITSLTHDFYEFLESVEKCIFSAGENDRLYIKFLFSSVWEQR